jgi:hypothetical protein
MFCYSPMIPNNTVTDPSGVKFSYGIQLDNTYIDRSQQNEMFTIYPDPIFEIFSDQKSYQSSTDNYLTINVSIAILFILITKWKCLHSFCDVCDILLPLNKRVTVAKWFRLLISIYLPLCCGFKSCQGLCIFSCEEVIQLVNITLYFLFKCPHLL